MSVQPNEALREARARIAELEGEVEKLRRQVPRNLEPDDARGISHHVEEYQSSKGAPLLDVERCSEMSEAEAETLAYHIMQWVRREDV